MTKKDFEQWLDERCVVKRKGIQRLYSEDDVRELMSSFAKSLWALGGGKFPEGFWRIFLKEGGWLE